MKPVVRLYALLIALTLVGLLAWSGADWYQRQQQSLTSGHAALRQAAGLISDLSIRKHPLDAPALSRAFARTGAEGRWKMILLSSPQGTEYYRGPRPAVPIDQAVPRWDARPLSEIKVTLPVFRSEGEPLLLEGIFEFYGRAEIFSLLRAAGVTLVVLLLLTTVMVFFLSRQNDEPEEAAAEPAKEPAPRPQAPPASEDERDEYWFDENLTLDDLPPMAEPAPKKDEPDPSLFSPSGLGWESFLTPRLDNELQRCASRNQDLSLLLFAAKDGTPTSEAWGAAIRGAFPSVDLNFEYEQGVAVVLPGQNLEQALKAARAFVQNNEALGVVHAGAAARTGRLLSAKTLLAEAGSAKRRSLAGTVRVLGLKTDPDRYREHLASASA